MAASALIEDIRADVAILGGGITGLWLLAHLRGRGYSAVLCEGRALGSGQTLASQGIIHGGLKYALTGTLSEASRALAHMPGLWRACLRGEKAPDLRGARLLSSHQYLVSGSRLAGFLASRLLQGRVAPVGPGQVPAPFAEALGSSARGAVYQLDEPVVDVRSVLAELGRAHAEALLAVDPGATRLLHDAGDVTGLEVRANDGRRLRILSERVVLCAGAGNEALGRLLPSGTAPMQRRPLSMVMLRGALPALYAHWLGTGASPRVTVTSHHDAQGTPVWYVGGELAESGVDREPEAQVRRARDELSRVLPGVDLSACAGAVLAVDRAEGKHASGTRPDGPVLAQAGAVTQVWPTKLAFAPRVAEQVEAQLSRGGTRPGRCPMPCTEGWPRPALAPLPWDEVRAWC
ncbi:FAD-dependent oxidoreductase [Corallococcus llansteffanensis]|uniref:FAD-dependent oxidoreductase n=1 Tax=Corallococcus llansteffanensis TaxID=2316731 RepID=A0A3A8QCX8_9BACT|nr:FAD-dependent oxidoreductase [Corallococcus llansteffanensis]RKH65968.1 FAD-dependent oxidoreductase [Corallococcus llansteffanensis]